MKALVVYSGGLDTTVCIPVLRSEGFSEIHTVTVDVGQPSHDILEAESRARILDTYHTTIDAKDEFARDYCSIAIKMNADYFGYPLSTAIARPIIAKKSAEHAIQLSDMAAIVHGCTGKGNDQFRIRIGLRQTAPHIKIKAPIRERNSDRISGN